MRAAGALQRAGSSAPASCRSCRYSRWSVWSLKITLSPPRSLRKATYIPPPYSCTSVRALRPSGVTSAIEPSGARRTTTYRPSSVGLSSIQYRLSPTPCGRLMPTPPSAMSFAVTGERQEP